jgi:hypothetical protein
MKQARFSSKKLAEFLVDNGFKPEGYTAKQVQGTCEAYGKDVRAYIGTTDMEKRARLEAALEAAGQMVNRNYWPGNPMVEVRVTYFKAWHWDE